MTVTACAPLHVDTVVAIQAELTRAVAKHGHARTPLDPTRTAGDNLTVLVEEVGEVARAMTYDEGDPARLHAELVQVAAMAAAWAQALSKRATNA